ncbi:MAG: helix-turn-helix domain-containing protein [Candidatus Poribacteria bacterium]|nr:helix-turn-helix domain-containing protein [Candidatus Poribacteria bacterium]
MKMRIRELVERKRLKEGRSIPQREIADALGISQQRVSNLMRGAYQHAPLKLLPKLARYFDVPPSALFEEIDGAFLPELGWISAGPPDEATQNVIGRHLWPSEFGGRSGRFVLAVKGDSMVDAHIPQGARVVVDPNLQARNGDIVAALINGESALKRLRMREGGRCALASENSGKNYPDIEIESENGASIQGVVVSILIIPENRRGDA